MLDATTPSPETTLARAYALIGAGQHAAAVRAVHADPAARAMFEAHREREAAGRFMEMARADVRTARRCTGMASAAWLRLAAAHRRTAGWHLDRARRFEAEARQ